MTQYDEYTEWVPEAVDTDKVCPKCDWRVFTLSGTCMRCKATREGLAAFFVLLSVVSRAWWSGIDDTTKRFMMMELQ